MPPSQTSEAAVRPNEFDPRGKLPAATLLRALSPDDQKIIRNLLSGVVGYIPNELFDRPDAHARLFDRPAALKDDSGVYQLDAPASDGTDPETRMFLRLNYCRKRVVQLLRARGVTRLTAADLQELLHWERAALEARNEIVRMNMPLVLAMAKRTRIVGLDVTDLISEGNLALLRAVFKFDVARGYKFSTYACRAILKSFSRIATRSARHRGHCPTEFDPTMERGEAERERRISLETDCLGELRSIMERNAAQLTDVEQAVIRARFALDDTAPALERRAKTLEQVGEMIGVTKERVRQIQNKALLKLRSALENSILAG